MIQLEVNDCERSSQKTSVRKGCCQSSQHLKWTPPPLSVEGVEESFPKQWTVDFP